MLSLEVCRKILNNSRKTYSDDEIKKIRQFLYTCAEIQIEANNFINKEIEV